MVFSVDVGGQRRKPGKGGLQALARLLKASWDSGDGGLGTGVSVEGSV